MPAFAISTGFALYRIWNTGISAAPQRFNCLIAAGRYTSHAHQERPLALLAHESASFAPLVVLPAPCRPTSITTLGLLLEMFSFWFSLPMSAQSSSLTILMTICAGGTLEHVRARRPGRDGLDEVLHDLEVHVRLEQRELHLAHGLLDVRLCQTALAAQTLEGLC